MARTTSPEVGSDGAVGEPVTTSPEVGSDGAVGEPVTPAHCRRPHPRRGEVLLKESLPMPAPNRQRRIAPIDIPRLPFVTHERPLFFAHRGGSALAPENTLPAYENGLRYGADALELDIHYTRDGEIVVIHDDLLDRTTDGSGPLAALTLDE